MTEQTISVLTAGWSVVQDLGRFGHQRFGVTVGGAADQYAARAANALVANAPANPLLELTALDVALRVGSDTMMSVTGAMCHVDLDGCLVQSWQPLFVRSGTTVTISGIHNGIRVYVAFNGTLECRQILGSVAPDAGLGVGTTLVDGSRLRLRSEFTWFDHPYTRVPVILPQLIPPRRGAPWTIDVLPGPDSAEFGSTLDRLVRETYVLEPQSNTIGLRLSGRAPERAQNSEILSRGVVIGAVEIPPSGQLLVLMRGRMLTAGYPVVAVASTVAQSLLGQAAPGEQVRFRWTTSAPAIAAARTQQAALDALHRRVATALSACGQAAAVAGLQPTSA